jgi:hypothetical protein
MGKKKGSSSKSKEVLVDEVEVLKVIENQEFVAMRVAEKVWPASKHHGGSSAGVG